MDNTTLGIVFVACFGGFAVTFILIKMLQSLRIVVDTNEVHIVQNSKTTVSYGKDSGNGNCYYAWPTWIPHFGVTTSVLPTNNFILPLDDYEAYDKGRLPFKIDIRAFFRISDSNTAAQRVASFEDLQKQLTQILKGSLRSILASSELEAIMQGRATFGELFTKEVSEQLNQWGVIPVRNIELMDIRDSGDSHVIANIMAKKQSFIEMESRTEVAQNMKTAQIAEVNANREVQVQKQDAEQKVGMRTVENKQAVQIATEAANQAIRDQQKLTKTKDMAIVEVERIRLAEIERNAQVVKADQDRQTSVITAEAKRQTTILTAEAALEYAKRESEGTRLTGLAKADAEKAMVLAPIQAQITLAAEIGSNEAYQKYLITIEQVKASQAVGIAQAAALAKADVKIITNSGTPAEGVTSVMDLFSAKGGTAVGAMLEGITQTKTGKQIIDTLNGGKH